MEKRVLVIVFLTPGLFTGQGALMMILWPRLSEIQSYYQIISLTHYSLYVKQKLPEIIFPGVRIFILYLN